MGFEDSSKKAFLQELYSRSEGDFEAQISMYDLGTDFAPQDLQLELQTIIS